MNSIEPKQDCYYHFPIDLVPNGVQFDAKSVSEKC